MLDYVKRKWRAFGALGRAKTIRRLSVDEVEQRLAEPGFFVFDANWRSLWRKGHVPGARHVAYDAFGPEELPADKQATLLFYCHNAL